MDDPGQVWDQLLASALTTISTQTSARRSTCPLRLRSNALITEQPDKPRQLSMIPADLRAAIRGCVTGQSSWPLVLCGTSGTGKTCAALCLLDYAGGRYWTAADLGDDLRDAEDGKLENREGYKILRREIWDRVQGAPLIVFDELGCRDRVSDFQYETAKRVLDKRHGKPLVVISNLTLKVLAELYDDRFVSRLAEGTVLEVSGADRRLDRVA